MNIRFMPNYHRIWAPGGTYFFTVNLNDRRNTLLVDNIDALRNAFCETRNARPFKIHAIVILPEHLHCLWQLPDGDFDYAGRWSQIKSCFSRQLPNEEPRSLSRHMKDERGIWQRRYWEHTIRNVADFYAHRNYIHINPLKHGHVLHVCDWPYSSFHQHVRRGIYPMDWNG